MAFFNKLTNWYFSRRALPYWCVLFADLAIAYLSGILVFWFYYRGAVTLGNIILLSKTIGIYMLINLVGFRVFHTYAGIVRYSSFEDLRRVAKAQILSCILAEVFHYIVYQAQLPLIPLEGRQVLLIYILSTILMWLMRVVVKTFYDESFNGSGVQMALIYGTGSAAVALAKSIRVSKPRRFVLRGFITTDRNLSRHNTLMGLPIYEDSDGLIDVIKRKDIQAVIVSPLRSDKFRNDQRLQDMLINSGAHIYMMPALTQWQEGQDVSVSQLHEIQVSDLLPRQEIQVDMHAIAGMLSGKRVLITGSAGSIGKGLVDLVAQFKPANMILIDQAETPQHDMRLMMASKYPDVKCETIVMSITQQDRMENVFKTYRPDVVFHAAAYKHVPMMEDNPCEAIYNNVWGTKVVADLCVKYGVKKMVMISTDKAVNPTNVMGCSKRICEVYCQSLDASLPDGSTQFVTTRFGNVLGSNGSVIPIFERQIKAGGPVTVTDPNIIRYFMLIPEACKLVLEAGTRGKGGQIFVFDMGKPVKIVDLARRMIQLSGAKDVEIKFTGLREGEKLYEEVLANDEDTEPSFHDKIRIAKVRQYPFDEVDAAVSHLIATAHTCDDAAVVKEMEQFVPEYHPAHTRWVKGAEKKE